MALSIRNDLNIKKYVHADYLQCINTKLLEAVVSSLNSIKFSEFFSLVFEIRLLRLVSIQPQEQSGGWALILSNKT